MRTPNQTSNITLPAIIIGIMALLMAVQNIWAAETAMVLPAGIFRARLVTIQTGEIGNSIVNNNELEPMANSLNRGVSVSELSARDSRIGDLVNALNTIEPGLGNNLMNSNLYGDLSVNVTTLLPAIEYGVTSRLALGLRIPIVTRRIDASFSANSVNNAVYAASQVGNLSPALTAALAQFGAEAFDTNMYIKSIFTDKGYEAPGIFNKTEVGDIELGGKYNFYNNDLFYATTQFGFRAPTGSTPSLTNVYDKGSGGGAWATGFSMLQEYLPTKLVSFSAMQKWTHYIPDSDNRAVPKDSSDSLPSLLPQDNQVQRVTRTQGEKLETELSSTLHFLNSDLNVWGAYQFMTKGRDSYNGPGNLYYDGLSKNSYQLSHNAELGIGYSTINAYKRKEFAVPGQIELSYNTTMAGQNVLQVNYVRMDMILYF